MHGGKTTRYECIEIKEGKTRFLVPKATRQEIRGPYRARGTGVFYNPQMEISRDLTIAVVDTYFQKYSFKDKTLKLLDGLAGTGVRGLRLAKESNIKNDHMVILNDGNPDAVNLIQKNIELNGIEDVTSVACENLNTLLSSSKFNFIDLDPFGTPVQFLDNAIRSVRTGGLLAVTATDTAPLSGTYPGTCRRRYGAEPLKNEYMHESGLRILAGYTARTASKYDLCLRPLLLYYMDYYFRMFFRVSKGAKPADKMLDKVGFVIHDNSSGARYVTPEPVLTEVHRTIGPLWIGELCDKEFVDTLLRKLDKLKTKIRLKKLCEQLRDEGDISPWFYEINKVSSLLKIQPMKFNKIKQILESNGFGAVTTHFSPQGFKTNATMDELRSMLLK